MRLNVYSSVVCAGGRPLCTQILPGRSSPAAILAITKLDTLHGLPECENRIPLRSLVFTQYRSVTDRQTDRQIGGFAAATATVSAPKLRKNKLSVRFRFRPTEFWSSSALGLTVILCRETAESVNTSKLHLSAAVAYTTERCTSLASH